MRKLLALSLIFAAPAVFAQEVPKCDPPKTCAVEMHPGHWVCEPCQKESKGNLSIHADQFFSVVKTPGKTAVVAPGHWMMDAGYQLAPRVKAKASLILAPDRLSFPKEGMPYPGIIGDGYVNNQHPHELISGAEAGIEVKLGDKKSLTVSGGPVIAAHSAPFFAMAPSSRGNMFPRQSHHSADSQHATPGGVQARYRDEKTMLSAAYLAGCDPNPRTAKIETCRPDSYTFGAERDLSGNFRIGGIAGKINHRGQHVPAPEDEHAEEAGHEASDVEKQLLATIFLTSRHDLHGGSLNTTTLFTRTRELAERVNSDGFSTEAAYRRGKNAMGGRFEVVDRDCREMGMHCTGQHKLKQYQGFGERQFAEKGGAKFFLNGSVTYADMPKAFEHHTGGNNLSTQGGIRVEFLRNVPFGGSAR